MKTLGRVTPGAGQQAYAALFVVLSSSLGCGRARTTGSYLALGSASH